MRSIRTLFTILFLAMGLSSLAMFAINQKVGDLRSESRYYQNELHLFYRLSQELKHSSDHLTKFARAYSATGDEYWVNMFNKVLDVRNGVLPIPEGNEYEYWDVIIHNKKAEIAAPVHENIPLLDRIRQSGIEAVEFLELKNALALSDALVDLEREAFMAIQGFKKSENGSFIDTGKPDLVLARQLLYGDQYFSEKSKIMAAIGSAHKSIVARIENKILEVDEEERFYQTLNNGLLGLLLSTIGLSFILLWRLYISPLSQLLKTVVSQVKEENYAFTITQTAYAELQRFIDSLNVVFHHIGQQLSHNTLVKDFNIIMRTNHSTQALCQEVCQFLLHQFPVQMVGVYIFQNEKLHRVSGVGYGDNAISEYTDPASTQMSVLLSGKPHSMKGLEGKYYVELNGGQLSFNELYYLPLYVNQQPVALLEIGAIEHLTEQQYQWLTQMLDDLSVSIQLSQNAELQRQAEQKVLEQSQLNQEILNATPNPMYCLSPEGKYLSVNAKFCDLVGLVPEQVTGKTPSDIFSPETAESFATAHKELSADSLNKDYELSMVDAENERKDMLVYEASFRNNKGKVSGIVGLLLDLTERKQMELDLREAKETADAMSQAKGDFLANMSHEIRTPMNAILGMAHLALNTQLDENQHKYVSRINESAKNLLGIINDILDFSKIEAGKLNVEETSFSLDEVLDNVTNVISLKAHEKDLEFLLDIDPKIPPGLVGDPLRLGQVIVNLCGNAVKFTEQGEIVVAARCETRTEDAVKLRFTVRDTGIGIPEDKLDSLFASFSQADSSITRKFGGTGLGLSISKQLVELMGGELSVTSKQGVGSVFEFTILCGLQEAKMRDISKPISHLAGKSALVLDDNDSARNILTTLLDAMHFKTKAVSNAFEAIDEIKSRHFDLLFLDWNMPGMNGIETAERMKNLGIGEQAKIFLVTAYGRELSLSDENSKLFDGLIVKPVNPSNLLDAIMNAYGLEHVRSNADRALNEKPWFSGEQVLLVEDNVVNQEVALGLLDEVNVNVVIANNGQEALDRLSEQAFDIVLMDMQMPILDGISATKKIRTLPQFNELPIIAMTANAMSSDVERCLEAGMNDHVAKPISVNNLYKTLNKFLQASESSIISEHPICSENRPALTNEDSSLPILSDMDVVEAVEAIGGNKKRYLEILQHFLEGQSEELNKLNVLIEKAQWEDASRLLHTLKGAASNLGVNRIADLAIEMEELVDRELRPSTKHIEQAQQYLETLSTQLSNWLGGQEQEEDEDCADAAELYHKLVKCVENYDAEAILVVQKAKACTFWNDEQKKQLLAAVEDFDFELAKSLLNEFPKPTD